jgi:hypothetical protein
LAVSFTDGSTAGTSPITSWSWNFDDSNTSSDQNPTHTYTMAGVYDVTLTVTDAAGQSATATCPVAAATTCFINLEQGGGRGLMAIDVAAELGLPADAVTVTSICQDEPLSGPRCGNFEPDGVIGDPPSIIEVRTEACAGPAGDNRYYHITLEDLPDGTEPPCGGTLRICKPQNQGGGGECTDDEDGGAIYDSTVPGDQACPTSP